MLAATLGSSLRVFAYEHPIRSYNGGSELTPGRFHRRMTSCASQHAHATGLAVALDDGQALVLD